MLTTLKGTRDRVRGDAGGEAGSAVPPASETGPAPNRSARYQAKISPEAAARDLSEALGGASESDRPVVAPPTRKPAPTSEADFTSRLLKAKKEARDQLRDEKDSQ